MKIATQTVGSSEGNIAARQHKQRGEEQLLSSSIMLNSHNSNSMTVGGASSLELGALVCFRPCKKGEIVPSDAAAGMCPELCPPKTAVMVAAPLYKQEVVEPSGLFWAAGWVFGACVVAAGLLTWLNSRKPGGVINISPGDSHVECASVDSYPQAVTLSSVNWGNGGYDGDCSASKAGALGADMQNLVALPAKQAHKCPDCSNDIYCCKGDMIGRP